MSSPSSLVVYLTYRRKLVLNTDGYLYKLSKVTYREYDNAHVYNWRCVHRCGAVLRTRVVNNVHQRDAEANEHVGHLPDGQTNIGDIIEMGYSMFPIEP